MARIWALLGLVWAWAVPAGAAQPAAWTLELTLHGRRIEGMPLAWDRQQVVLLGRDGQLWQFHPGQAREFRKVSDRFQGYCASELRASLLRQLGKHYEVSGTGHYLVAHPAGMKDQWADRFERLYRTFIRYFSVRGFSLQEPPFLLIAVVCKDREDFLRQAAAGQIAAGRGLLGYYSTQTNRIVLYDPTGTVPASERWQQAAMTVIHEATHQVAFNTGVHSRYSPPPMWVAEGLATMFERVGAGQADPNGTRQARLHPGWYRRFQEDPAGQQRSQRLAELVASDGLFDSEPVWAYAASWALSFYLAETQPRQYAEYLQRTARHPPFQPASAAQRIADFTAVFGEDWRMLDARLRRFLEELR